MGREEVWASVLTGRSQAAGLQNREAGLRTFLANSPVRDKNDGRYCNTFHSNGLPCCLLQFTFILGSCGAHRKKGKEDEKGNKKVEERGKEM